MSKSDEVIGGIQGEVHVKTPGLYQVPKLRNFNFCCCTVCFLGGSGGGGGGGWDDAGVLGGGPRENPRSLASPKAEKKFAGNFSTDGPTDRVTYTSRWSRLKITELKPIALTCTTESDSEFVMSLDIELISKLAT